MVVFSVVSLIAEDFVDSMHRGGLLDSGTELRRVVRRADGDERTEPEVRLQIANDRQLRPCMPRMAAAKSPAVVAADMTSLESRRIDGGSTAIR